METEKETVTEGTGQDADRKQSEQANIKVENTEDGTTTVVGSIPSSENLADASVDQGEEKVEAEQDGISGAGEKREVTPESSEYIEFEFSPIKKVPSGYRDGSSSPDAEDVLDQLYEAAKKGDSGKVCNLIFSGKDANSIQETDESIANADISEDKYYGTTSDINQNQAIINLLKRKTPIEKERIADWVTSKKPRLEGEKVIDFTDVKNYRNFGTLPLGSLLRVVPQDKTYPRRKNPNRTPTPPNLSPTPQPYYKPKLTVQNLLNSIGTIPQAPQLAKLQKSGTPGNQSVEKNLIDYSVLTRALTKTLESKLKEGEDNDVKIVIFCNNKPIQSFSVKSNSKAGTTASRSGNSPASKGPQVASLSALSSNLTEKLLKMPVETVTNVNDILSHNPTYLSKQLNQNLGIAASSIPTIGDVKAILERNRRVARESLARFCSSRTKTKRIPDEKLNLLLKEFRTKTSDSDSDSSSTHVEANNSDSKKKPESDEEDLDERILVINDTVKTNEKSNKKRYEAKCDQCFKTFKKRRYMNRHKIRVHGSLKQAVEETEKTYSKVSLPESENTKIIEDLLATPIDSTFGNLNSIPQTDENIAIKGKKLDGTVDDKTSVNVTEFDEVGVKTEPVSDLEDQEIQTLLADDKLMNLLEPADKNKRALFTQDAQHHGVLAKDILRTNYKAKAYSFDYRPPVTEEGLIEPVYVCEQCGKFYRARKTLKDHFLRQHAKDKDDEPLYLYITGNKYQCPICFNNYHSGSELVSHTKKHTGELRSVCKLCGKVYSSVHVLRRHIDNIHSDVKPRPFQCELCDYAASNKWHLKEHYRRHTGEQPYKCPVCVKSFSHQGTMNRHCKTIHKLEIPSQRPFARNNICDLPDLPTDSVENAELQSSDENRLMCPEEVLPDSPNSDNGLDIDLSIVKTEAEDVDIDN